MEGRFDAAIDMYCGKPMIITPAIELGKLKDQIWTNHILDTGSMHPDLGGAQIVGPICQQKYEKLIPFDEDYQILFRGVPDLECQWNGIAAIRDFKCGTIKPVTYVDKWQLDAYKLLRPRASIGFYDCYNPFTEVLSVGIKFLDNSNAELALHNIITYAGEMINSLRSEKLLIDYKPEIYADKGE